MSISPITCLFYRISGSLLSCTSVFTIILVIRYFAHRYRRQQQGVPLLPLSPILSGMLISFMLILSTGIPLVLIQCFTCRPFKAYVGVCIMNAFICFTVGTFNMYMLALLSIFRYINIVHKGCSFIRFFEHHRGLSVMICAVISLCWSFPPLLNVGNTYTMNDIGFHCSLDWNNAAFQSRIYVYSLLMCNYFLLLFVVIYSNLRVYLVLRYLIKSQQNLDPSLISTTSHLSTVNLPSSVNVIHQQSDLQQRLSNKQVQRKLSRLQRLKLDRRYARIVVIVVTQFIIAWTPYAIVALIIINGQIEFVRRHPLLPTLSELLAKFSLVLNPLILIYTNKMRQH